jgi:hypothetical protein
MASQDDEATQETQIKEKVGGLGVKVRSSHNLSALTVETQNTQDISRKE